MATTAQDKIRRVRENQATSLDLSGLGLSGLPAEIVQLTQLQTLKLVNNHLSELPAEITHLTRLKTLDLANNVLTDLPGEIGQLTQLQTLDLMGNRLSELPMEITQLTQLESLALSNNVLLKLPMEIIHLTELQTLNLRGNRLSELPSEIAQLPQLQTLNLRGNRLRALPVEIGRLCHLHTLVLGDNRLSELPAEIAQLTQLRTLVLGGNLLSALPTEIGQLTQLKTVYLGDNRLSEVPAEIVQLTELQTLDLRGNRLSELPAEIAQLTRLQILDLRDNRLSELPAEIALLTRLKKLLLHGNEALDFPPEVLGDDRDWKNEADPAEILDFYFRRRQEPSQALLEAKILVVGQGAVGKTSLIKRLVEKSFNPDEQRTDGIEIARWQLETYRNSMSQTVRLNIWDFGGQEIMHATHQFFLTKRSLYLLVLDARKGKNESNLFYWLRLIRSFATDSPVLVVINKSEGANQPSLNERRLRTDYPSILGFLKTSCLSGQGVGELEKAIVQAIQGLHHIYDLVPASFFAVKEALEKRTREEDVLEVEAYESLCAQQGISERSSQSLLLRFLHDLGSVLHFKDPDSPYLLEDTHVLNPQWVTQGVYKILNEPTFLRAGGKIKLSQLARVLKAQDGYPKKRRLFIIGMMQKFELCFEFPEEKALLVPELLPANEPDLGWEQENALRFEYHYAMLPEGILPRFVVRTQAHQTDKPTYWKSGVLLQIDDNRALVRGDTQLSRVFIAVRGPKGGRRRALSVVRAQLREIHATVPGIEAEGRIPLPLDAGRTVSYQYLCDLEGDGVRRFRPEGAKRHYVIRELLEGIEQASALQRRGDDHERDHELRGRPRHSQQAAASELFLSYAWGGESEELAGEIEKALSDRDLRIIRVKRDLGFKGSIRKFMERLGAGRAVVLVISDKYLRSKFCMFELVAIFESGQFRERIVPIVASSAKIHDSVEFLDYVKFWEDQAKALEEKMRGVDLKNLQGVRDDLDLYGKIRAMMARLTDELKDMNTLNVATHRDAGFQDIVDAVELALLADFQG